MISVDARHRRASQTSIIERNARIGTCGRQRAVPLVVRKTTWAIRYGPDSFAFWLITLQSRSLRMKRILMTVAACALLGFVVSAQAAGDAQAGKAKACLLYTSDAADD